MILMCPDPTLCRGACPVIPYGTSFLALTLNLSTEQTDWPPTEFDGKI